MTCGNSSSNCLNRLLLLSGRHRNTGRKLPAAAKRAPQRRAPVRRNALAPSPRPRPMARIRKVLKLQSRRLCSRRTFQSSQPGNQVDRHLQESAGPLPLANQVMDVPAPPGLARKNGLDPLGHFPPAPPIPERPPRPVARARVPNTAARKTRIAGIQMGSIMTPNSFPDSGHSWPRPRPRRRKRPHRTRCPGTSGGR